MNTACTVYLKSFYTKYLLKNGVGLQQSNSNYDPTEYAEYVPFCTHTGVCFVFMNDKEM